MAGRRLACGSTITGIGLLLNAVGGVLLLICHFPLSLPSGDAAAITDEASPWAFFWGMVYTVGSFTGLVLTILGIYLQWVTIRRAADIDR